MVRKTRLTTPRDMGLVGRKKSTSGLVKAHLGNQRATFNTHSEPSQVLETVPTKHIVSLQILQPLALVHLDELAKIWDADKRTPSASSRRTWALARNLKPEHVHRWWYRRKKVAKKARIKIPNGTYELPVGTPPIIEPTVKEEPDTPEPSREVQRVSDLHSGSQDDSFWAIATDSTQIGSDGFEISSSSDTVVEQSQSLQVDQNHNAYSRSKHLSILPLGRDFPSDSTDDFVARIPSSPLLPSSSPVLASPEHCGSRYLAPGDLDKIANSSQPICNQGNIDLSSFTCPLCMYPTLSPDLEPFCANNQTSASTTLSEFFLRPSNIQSPPSSTNLVPHSPWPSIQLCAHIYNDATWCIDGRTYSHDGSFLEECTGDKIES